MDRLSGIAEGFAQPKYSLEVGRIMRAKMTLRRLNCCVRAGCVLAFLGNRVFFGYETLPQMNKREP